MPKRWIGNLGFLLVFSSASSYPLHSLSLSALQNTSLFSGIFSLFLIWVSSFLMFLHILQNCPKPHHLSLSLSLSCSASSATVIITVLPTIVCRAENLYILSAISSLHIYISNVRYIEKHRVIG
ncbi:hypothetical protein Ancab_022357 [Ancistrocladus abbreviatus]